MKKRLLTLSALILALVLVFAITSCGIDGETEEAGTPSDVTLGDGDKAASDGLSYLLSSDGTYYSVTGIGTCTDTDLVIPSKHNGVPVTVIGDSAFLLCASFTSITIPDSVTTIGDSVFGSCTKLTNVAIPDSVTLIGTYAFDGCTSITSIKYRGTEDEWNAISKGSWWDDNTGNYTITYNYDGE